MTDQIVFYGILNTDHNRMLDPHGNNDVWNTKAHAEEILENNYRHTEHLEVVKITRINRDITGINRDS